jgi:type VI secretion system ImpC/EvpB family protein
MRLPYEDDGARVDGFRFSEDVARPDRSQYLWGNAAYAFGAVAIRAFAESGWLAGIRGVRRGEEGGGLVPGLPVHSFSTDRRGIAPKCSTDAVVTDFQEQELGELGFIPLCHCADTEFSAFYGNQSAQKAKKYDEPAATVNARLSTMLQYMLCVARFAHYLKVQARDKIGSFSEASDCEYFLHNWLQQYVTSDGEASREVKARYPLREASVKVRENPEKPGAYLCVAHLWPHFELDELSTTMRITTELTHGTPP